MADQQPDEQIDKTINRLKKIKEAADLIKEIVKDVPIVVGSLGFGLMGVINSWRTFKQNEVSRAIQIPVHLTPPDQLFLTQTHIETTSSSWLSAIENHELIFRLGFQILFTIILIWACKRYYDRNKILTKENSDVAIQSSSGDQKNRP